MPGGSMPKGLESPNLEPAGGNAIEAFTLLNHDVHQPEIVDAAEFDKTIDVLFKDAVAKFPDEIALIGADSELTYRSHSDARELKD